ncbi:MAG TPA: hypothetical protein VKQ36_10610, partial [Ktedonobacterales bacterium]|nr:hypothetical protein [Ktedonobacterales bacterium]
LNINLPDAHGADGLLDFVLIKAPEPGRLRATFGHLVSLLRHLGAPHEDAREHDREHAGAVQVGAARGEHGDIVAPGVRRFRARAVVIETPDEPVDVTLDGELRAHTPLYVRVAPKPMWVFAPPPQLETSENA